MMSVSTSASGNGAAMPASAVKGVMRSSSGRRPDGRQRPLAAIGGLIRWVRPPRPWRSSKLRFDVEAQRSPGFSRSSFIATHIEQPDSRHSKPASRKIRSSPSASACRRTAADPGTTIAVTRRFTWRPATTRAAARKSSSRALVQEPMNTRSTATSSTRVPAVRPM